MKKEELIKEIKKESKKQVTERVAMTKEEQELNLAAFKAASLPIEFKDSDFKLGMQELDIRKLNDANFKQLVFRLLSIQTSQTRQLTQIVIDLERLIMLLLGTHGIPAEKIGSAINDLIDKLTKESEKFDPKQQKGTPNA